METTLHRQLKQMYASDRGDCEVVLGRYRIDARRRGQLIEIQHGSLAAIRRKTLELLAEYRVLVVKPLIARKHIIRLDQRGGEELSRRLSPKREASIDVFHELMYFRGVFPHPRLTIEIPLVEIEELRYPGHGRRRRWRKDDHRVQDQRLTARRETLRLKRPADLLRLLSLERGALPAEFDTQQLAAAIGQPRWIAQRVVYCLRHMQAAEEIGKRGNSRVYRLAKKISRAA